MSLDPALTMGCHQPYGNAAFSQDNLAEQQSEVDPLGPVEFCHQTAGIEEMAKVGLQHHWLRTPNKEAGLGAAPGVPFEYGGDMEITSHAGRGESEGAHCYPVHEEFGHAVDPACIDDRLTVGRELGPYGITNQCQSTIADIVAECQTWEDPDFITDPDAYERYSGERSSGAGGGSAGTP